MLVRVNVHGTKQVAQKISRDDNTVKDTKAELDVNLDGNY